MPTDSGALRPNLEYYRKLAKSLLKDAQSGDARAQERISQHATKPGQPLALHQALRAIAKEHGFASWPRFRAFIVESSLDPAGLAAEFVKAALEDVRRAQDLLARHPDIAHAGLYVALVSGDVKRVDAVVSQSPAIALTKGGPRNWEPLLYVCFSRFAGGGSPRAADFAETARLLIGHGADVNASYVHERWPNSPLSCLYAAAGLNNNTALAHVLLDAGANPNDGESVYHSTEHYDLACFRLLLERGASLHRTNALKHMLDREEMEGLRLLLAAGADPNEVNQRGETALHWAVWRGRSTEAIAALLNAGAAVDARRNDGRTPYGMAVQSGQWETARLLESRGANTNISALDRFIGECAAAVDSDGIDRILREAPKELPQEYHRFLADFAENHCVAGMRVLLASGVPVDARSEHGGTALHWACWKGYADEVKVLLEHGASLTIEDDSFHAPPPGWFSHGVQNCGERAGDYPEVARLLIAAGARFGEKDVPTGDEAVDAVLKERGVI